jgi:phosphatidylserine/phosphatidylglycerophosphate/cardiolipin synthase-like enzyme
VEDWISVFFTDPENPNSKNYRGGPDQLLAEAINRAHVSVDIAVQQLNLWSIRDALIVAHRRGVQVRMVTESDYIDEKEVQQIIQAGIPVIGDRRQGLMHNKFVIIDRSEVWIGSMNFTVSEGYRNNNTLMHITSPRLAENYEAEFEEMFTNDSFGPGSPADTPQPNIRINQTSIETCFSPEDGCTAKLVETIRTAKESVYFLAFSFTSDELADALIERANQGIDVQGIMEADQAFSNRDTDYNRFLTEGVDVRLDGNPAQMHHKIIIIDQKIVATGSFNFTFSAETANDENLLIIEDPEIAEFFLQEYQRVLNQTKK